ncbi:MAG: HD domain-containing protein [Desulfobulbaceae bacterium]
MKSGRFCNRKLEYSRLATLLGEKLSARLAAIAEKEHGPLYLTGGTVRDIVMDRRPADIDLTVAEGGRRWAAELCRLSGSTYVPLGKEEDAARVVWQGRDIDFSSYREGAQNIEQELVRRDITVNSMAISLEPLLRGRHEDHVRVIDPAGGLADIEARLIRTTFANAFRSDPLRLLRVYRFAAILDFRVEAETVALIRRQKELISRVAAERVTHELDLIMASGRAFEEIAAMAESGLLFEIIPELKAGVGMAQPASHHLDVFEHSLVTLQWMQQIQKEPGRYFSRYAEVLTGYLAAGRNLVRLRWAALLHDLGKPTTMTINEDRGGRITFYNHDQAGASLVVEIGRRLRWSGDDISAVAGLVGLHMRPFHLGNVQRQQGELSLKACLRLIKFVGSALPGLFLLSMADALAGQGEGRPAEVEQEVAALFARMEEVRREHVEPVRGRPPLISGRDLISELGLEPGPVFREVLEMVEEVQMEGGIASRGEALDLARRYLAGERTEG